MLHVAIFLQFSTDDSAANDESFFCTVCTLQFFPLVSAGDSEEGEKLSLSRFIF